MNSLVRPDQPPDGLDRPPSWNHALQEVARQGDLCLVVGPVDAGKSSFCLLAANEALGAGRRPALIDTDPGQSDIGPPAALGLALVEKPLRELTQVSPTTIHFIGATSPVGHLLEIVTGATRLVEHARKLGADLLIVNTSGIVTGPGRALKTAKIRLLAPSHIVSIAPEAETEPILAPLRGRAAPVVYRLKPSSRALRRDAEERRRRRECQFAAYFREAQTNRADLRELVLQGTVWRSGEPLAGVNLSYARSVLGTKVLWGERTPDGAFFIVEGAPDRSGEAALAETFGGDIKVVESCLLENLLVGLIDREGEDMAMGIIKQVDFKQQLVTLISPRIEPERLAGLRLGTMRLRPDGTELGALPTSTWG